MTDCKNKGDATRFLEQYEWNVESATAAFVNSTTTTSNAQASTMRHRVQPVSRSQQTNRAVCDQSANSLYPEPISDLLFMFIVPEDGFKTSGGSTRTGGNSS